MRRRAFLQGALGLAGTAAVAACGGGGGTQTLASCVSGLSFPSPKRTVTDGLVVSKTPDVPVAWTKYPKPYRTMDTPGKGGTVTTFQILFQAPPPALGQNRWWQELNKRLNVTWQPSLAASPDYPAKLNALAAGGSFPDITYINFNPDGKYGGEGFKKFVSQGAFHDLTSMLSGKGLEQFPNLKLVPPVTWKGSSFEGKIWGVPYPIQPSNGHLYMYRKDWAQKLGVDNPKNADEVMRMFVAFAKEDPDGNGKADTWGLDYLRPDIWSEMFRAPNNWRLNKDGSLTKDLETEEFKASVDFARQLWAKGAFHPDALTNTLNQRISLLEGGRVGSFSQGGWAFFGNQPGTMYTLAKQYNPQANPAPWIPPGHDGGKAAIWLGSASYGFGAIPSTIKDEKRIQELLHIMEWMASPFGSEEFTFMYHGIEGTTFNYVDGAPVNVADGNQNMLNGLNYLCGPGEINYYYPGQPDFAKQMQGFQEQQMANAVADPTLPLYSQTWVAQAGTLVQMQNDAYNSIISGQKPLSYLKDVISSWKSQGGDAARKEFQKSLEKCH